MSVLGRFSYSYMEVTEETKRHNVSLKCCYFKKFIHLIMFINFIIEYRFCSEVVLDGLKSGYLLKHRTV